MRSSAFTRRIAVVTTLTAAAVVVSVPAANAALPFGTAGTRPPAVLRPVMPFDNGPLVPFRSKLFDGRSVDVAADGSVNIMTPFGKRTHTERRRLSALQRAAFHANASPADRDRALYELAKPRPAAYAAHSVIVVFKDGTTIPTDRVTVPATMLRTMRAGTVGNALPSAVVPRYTTDDRTNAVFGRLAVSATERLFGGVPRGTLTQAAARAGSRARGPVLNLGNAFRLTVTNAPLASALRQLTALPNVAYVGRDYRYSSMAVSAGAVPAPAVAEAQAMHPRRAFGRAAGPGRRVMSTMSATPALDNFMVTSSGQAFLNAPGVDAIAAFDEIAQNFPGQLPGAGVTITNVSLGDVDDASAATNATDPCNAFVTQYGPTTHMIGGQRYLDLPSMPLIPTYVASPSGTLSGSAETCGMDPFLQEVGLDFAVMAPLPHALQRAGEAGSGLTDLLGIAPGANYRLVVPAVNDTPSLLGAIIGAASQSPAPDIITMSIGWSLDQFGFPGRYFEDDALARSVAATVTNTYNIPLFIAANDGTRAGVGAAIGPSGGSAATNVAAPGAPFTTLDDIGFTTSPSVISDTGAIDVGGTTLDDVVSANPQDPASGALANMPTFPETRFNGFNAFSSGFGARVNISAPSDNIYSLVRYGKNYDSTLINITGGTSASAPIAAAVAAVAIQVARLEGHPFTSPAALRTFLAATGTPPAQSAVTDTALNVGPQVSARRVVESLLGNAHVAVSPSVGRVAITQRKVTCVEYGGCSFPALLEYVDPAIVSLRLPLDNNGQYTGARTNDFITIAPDWEGLPANATYRLTIAGKPSAVLSTSSYARLLPAQIFAAAGIPLASTGVRTVSLAYQSTVGLHVAAQTTFDITFGPATGTSTNMLAPIVPPVVSTNTMPVTYDISMLPASIGPVYLTIWLPDRFDGFSRLLVSQPLSTPKGTISIPVSSLAGSGVYMMQLWYGGVAPAKSPLYLSATAYTRVSQAGTSKPPAPLLGLPLPGAASGHALEVAYAQPITIGWDASHVPNASGAIAEVNFGGPTNIGNYNTFDNPNGSEIDANGVDSPSVYHQPLPGLAGTITLDPRKLNVFPGVVHSVRILATNGGNVVGEASDTSVFEMDGVLPPDGGTVYAHALNTNGTDGFLMSLQEGCFSLGHYFQYFGNVGVGTTYGSNAMTFDQSTLQITNPAVILPSASCDSQPMVLGSDIGFFYDRSARTFTTVPAVSAPSPLQQYLALPPNTVPNDGVVQGGPFPPFPEMESLMLLSPQEYVGGDASSTKASFLGLNVYGAGPLNQATAVSIDVSSGVSTPVMSIPDFATFGFPVVLGTAYDPGRNIAYTVISDDFNATVPATVVATDFGAGTYSLFSLAGDGPGNGIQGMSKLTLDAVSQKLLFVTDAPSPGLAPQFHIVDLKSRAVSIVTPPLYAVYAAFDDVLCDPVNHLFILVAMHNYYDQANEMYPSAVDVFDESGNLVAHRSIPFTFDPYFGGLGPGQQLTFVNGSRRRLFMPAPPSLSGTYEPQLMAIDY